MLTRIRWGARAVEMSWRCRRTSSTPCLPCVPPAAYDVSAWATGHCSGSDGGLPARSCATASALRPCRNDVCRPANYACMHDTGTFRANLHAMERHRAHSASSSPAACDAQPSTHWNPTEVGVTRSYIARHVTSRRTVSSKVSNTNCKFQYDISVRFEKTAAATCVPDIYYRLAYI